MAVLENSVVGMVSGAVPPSSLALHTPQANHTTAHHTAANHIPAIQPGLQSPNGSHHTGNMLWTGASPGRHLKASFQFGCKPPSPIAEWQPELIQALHPLPPVASSLAAIADAAPGPSIPRPLPHTGRHHLGSEEFDHLAQMMVGSALVPGDDVKDPKPDEVLENLINLHHLARVHEWVLPAVESSLDEVDKAEAESGQDM
ncbi:hypothetical protein BDR07DRAFT_1487790 [Suillus spraguei]|nr:hypothetical protein BDR07DRAFT_1487790 [Suillus spraguei]